MKRKLASKQDLYRIGDKQVWNARTSGVLLPSPIANKLEALVLSAESSALDFHAVVSELNKRAGAHPIGGLQEMRANVKGLVQRPGSDLFSRQTTKANYAFHHGGRSELQFNVGIEPQRPEELRYGVAFSFQANRTLLSPVDALAPKVRLFNEFMDLYAELFGDLRMWHFEGGVPSPDHMPGPIPWERIKEGVFVFLGKREPLNALDYEDVLSVFDRLLPLYRYVESGGSTSPVSMPSTSPFEFRPGCPLKTSATVATHAQKESDVALRHNEMQIELHRRLVAQFGYENVGTENSSGAGTRVDVIVRRSSDEYWFYEIKTFQSPRACLREAIGQLLEYSFWPGARGAARLIVVGETAIDNEGSEYLRCLRERFSLPIEYEQIRT